eukprot:TRINITY_DN20413_c0_g1_i1.p1 TRINITY_DN20413_c0_g1~~TRINITY_DN20413_c0_g1_i1.p1  ORF type:complete len:358 (-),score=82.01 TRINITY_DN20413_c0_g1_i1:121-1194(-)
MAERSKLLWVDKHRPTSLDQTDYHDELSSQLKKMVKSGDFPHLLVYGPSGAGKKTRIMALLREIYGPSALKLRMEHRSFKPPNSAKTLELSTVSSPHHIEMNPSDLGHNDRLVVQEVIKEIAQSHPIDGSVDRAFKIVLLNEVDKLSRDAQHALRRTMEKYMSTCRIILCCNSMSKVIEPVRSRCLAVRVAAPTPSEIVHVLNSVSKKEGVELPPELATRIAEASEGNLRRAILSLEAAKVKHGLTPTTPVELPDWENYIILLAKEIFEEQSPKRLHMIRAKLYELLTHCIPAEIIIKKLTSELLKKLDSELKYEVVHWAAFYEHRLQTGSKHIFHLEAFVAKFMSIYKRFLISTFG